MNSIYLIVGPSGCGKTTIADVLQKRFGYSVLQSYTDRPPRHPNEEGHIFLSAAEFDKLTDICAYTKFCGYRYCATKELIDTNDLYVIDVNGVEYMRRSYKGDKNLVIIGITADEQTLGERMYHRGDREDLIEERLENDRKTFRNLESICNIVIPNYDLEKAVAQVVKAISYFETANNFPIAAHKSNSYMPQSNKPKLMKVVLDENALPPMRAHLTDAGFDLKTPIEVTIPARGSAKIDTGVHVALPSNTYGKLESKSGLNIKHGIVCLGGVIDEGYTGSIVVKLYNMTDEPFTFYPGDKVVQMLVLPCYYPQYEIIESLEATARGDNGFGSTGK